LLPEEVNVRTKRSETVVKNEKVGQVSGKENNGGDSEVTFEHILE